MSHLEKLPLKSSNPSRARERTLSYALLTVAVTAFLLVFSVTTSPLTPGYYGNDSAVFQLLGRAWKDGHVIYRDLFDHKGPIIFLIDMLGELLLPDRTGIFLIQILFGSATVFGFYETARIRFRPTMSLGISLYCLFCLVTWYGDGGNMTEEYCLPFLTWSLYFVVRYGLDSEHPHPPLRAFFYGVAFAVCLLTRLTNAICLCVWVLAIVLHLIFTKRWKNLFANAGAFLAGLILITAPFVLYFALNHALDDFWFGMIGLNMSVVSGRSEMEFYAVDAVTFLRLSAKYIPLWLPMLGGVYRLIRREYRMLSLSMIASGALFAFYVLWNRAVFLHYQMVNLPLTVAGLILCFPPREEAKPSGIGNAERILATLLTIAMLGFSVNIAIRYEVLPGNAAYRAQVAQTQAVAAMLDTVPQNERDRVAVYNILPDVLLSADILPCYQFSLNLDIHMRFSDDVTRRVREQFASRRAKWVFVTTVPDEDVQHTLSNFYTPVTVANPVEGYTLYRLLP